MKQRTSCFHIYLGMADWFIGTFVTLLYYLTLHERIFLLLMPLAYVVVASTGNWIKTKVKVDHKNNFHWRWGFRWPPHLCIGKPFYDGSHHYVAQLGPLWIGREP